MPSIKVRKYKDSVYVIYSHKNKKFKVFTGVRLKDCYWNLCTPTKSCPDIENVTLQISSLESRVLNASLNLRTRGLDPTVDLVRKEIHKNLNPGEVKLPFWELYKKYLAQLTCRPSTIRKVSGTYKVLENYCAWSGYKFEIETFDNMEFGRFIQYMLLEMKSADATVFKHVKQLRAFLKHAYSEKDWTFVRYSMLKWDQDVIALTDSELRYLIHAELGGHLDKTRDLFIFLATTGMRYCDSQLYDPSWITEEKILEFTQLKTGGKAYPPLYEISRKILSKYKWLPPQLSNQRFNAYLKELFD